MMNRKPYDGPERREYTRYEMTIPIFLEVMEPGSQSGKIRGTTINVSRGGILADLGIAPTSASRCRVTFEQAGGRVVPGKARGRIVHVSSWKQGRHAVAVQFENPLEILKPPGEL